MHYTGMASARHAVSDTPSQHSNATVGSFTAMYASMLGSTFFLWAIVLLIIADLRMWFYAQSKKLREIDDMMQLLDATANKYHASQLAVTTYKSIRQQDAIDSERVKNDASKVLGNYVFSRALPSVPISPSPEPFRIFPVQ